MYEYFYANESEQFAFYRIPKQLMTDEVFSNVSTDAKLLYGLMLDRMGLSKKNGWIDGQNRTFIYFQNEEIQDLLRCSHAKVSKLFGELDTKKGVGLIEIINQGQGRPRIIYVKNFVSVIDENSSEPVQRADCKKVAVKTSNILQSRLQETSSPDCKKIDGIYMLNKTEKNKTEKNKTVLSIDPSIDNLCISAINSYCAKNGIDRMDYLSLLIKQNCSEDFLVEDVDKNDVIKIAIETMRKETGTFAIGGAEIPATAVQEKFLRLKGEHITYVEEMVLRRPGNIRNITAYIRSSLYNAVDCADIGMRRDIKETWTAYHEKYPNGRQQSKGGEKI